jgi:hypothetical protein
MIRTGAVYFFSDVSGGPIKIGFTAGPIRFRLRNLRTQTGKRLVCLGWTPGTYTTEKVMHRAFASSCVGGEWFSRSDELMEVIASVAGGKEVPAHLFNPLAKRAARFPSSDSQPHPVFARMTAADRGAARSR